MRAAHGNARETTDHGERMTWYDLTITLLAVIGAMTMTAGICLIINEAMRIATDRKDQP